MRPQPAKSQIEDAEDVFFGQIVMVWARWCLAAACAVLILWTGGDLLQLTGQIAVLVALMGVNFYLHGRYLMEKPANRYLIALASLLDAVLVTTLVAAGPLSAYASPLFVLYYPVVFAFSLVFPARASLPFTVAVSATYLVTVLLVGTNFAADLQQDKILILRLVTLAATGCLGTYYWRIQRRRRHSARSALLAGRP